MSQSERSINCETVKYFLNRPALLYKPSNPYPDWSRGRSCKYDQDVRSAVTIIPTCISSLTDRGMCDKKEFTL